MSNQLILPSLEIRQFRILRKLEIERLGRVNLIVGKNNVGKTSVLEAIYLYANPGNPEVLLDLISTRDEFDQPQVPQAKRPPPNARPGQGDLSWKRGNPRSCSGDFHRPHRR